MVFNFRDKILVTHNSQKIEGYIYQILPNNREAYVVLSGQNNKPVLVELLNCEKIQEPPLKRKRGRPKKASK